MTRRPLAVVLAAVLGFVACKHEPEPAQYPGTGPQPSPTYAPAPSTPPAPAPSPAPTPAPPPTSTGPAPAAGLPCSYDTDLVCPFGRCLTGRCGGCRSEADCKPGAACLNTPVGLACMPGNAPAPAPTPAPPPPATSPPAPAPAPTPTPAPAPVPYASAREHCIQKTNEYRATKGLSPLTRRSDRESCTDGQAQSDATKGAPHGAFGQCSELAQNECPGWKGTPEAIVDSCLKAMFDEGPGQGATHGHYSNLMSPGYTGASCGFFVASDGSVWMVQDFYK